MGDVIHLQQDGAVVYSGERERTDGLPFHAAVFVENSNMAPAIQRGSMVFLAAPGFQGEGIYSIPHNGEHRGDLRRVSLAARGWLLSMDGWPDADGHVVTLETLQRDPPAMVLGVASPFRAEFSDFLRHKFAIVQGDRP